MAYFFEAWLGMTKEQASVAADRINLTKLPITAGGVGVFGLWGGGPDGEVLKIKVYRGGAVVNEGAKPAVRVTLLLRPTGVPEGREWTLRNNERVRIFQATGLKPGDEIHGVTSAGQRYTDAPLTVAVVGGSAADVMQDWANKLMADAGYKPSEPFLCPIATSYLSLTLGSLTPSRLNEALVGGPMTAVHGLAIHCTAGGTRDVWGTAINGCVNTWNANYAASKFVAAAHFAISAEGTIVQFIPTNRIAWAQGTPGDRNWISVEVENNGVNPMLPAQLDATRRLFAWVCATYPVQRRLAMGTLFANKIDVKYKKELDAATTAVCDAAGAPTTRQTFEATFARGLSCHLWLDARNSKPCPGVGILGQMLQITKG